MVTTDPRAFDPLCTFGLTTSPTSASLSRRYRRKGRALRSCRASLSPGPHRGRDRDARERLVRGDFADREARLPWIVARFAVRAGPSPRRRRLRGIEAGLRAVEPLGGVDAVGDEPRCALELDLGERLVRNEALDVGLGGLLGAWRREVLVHLPRPRADAPVRELEIGLGPEERRVLVG
jgi:hypothetical protein